MPAGELRFNGWWRFVRRAPAAAALILLPFLSGCLPGFQSGSDDAQAGFSADGTSSAVNRSDKTGFLSLGSLSITGRQLRERLTPDSGPGLFSTVSTSEEARQAPQPGATPVSPLTRENAPVFERAVLPPAQSLRNFYETLAALTSGRRRDPITILHFGDDHIVDDRFAGELRDYFISRFGNAGRGLMMPGLFSVRGMKADRGGVWKLASSAAGDPGTYGITGVRVSAKSSDAWMRFTATQGSFDWLEVTFATGPTQGSAVVTVDGEPKLVPAATPSVSQTSFRLSTKAHEIVIRPRGDGEISILSVATGTNTPGIRYANLGLPGATAATPGKWNAQFAANDFERINPNLIVLEYGTREGFDDHLNPAQYEIRLRLLIDQLKQWAPLASLLIIGPPDAARLPAFAGSAGAQVCRALNPQELDNYDRMLAHEDERLARWHAPPRLEAVRAALRRTAASSGIDYWDWAKFMGGPCSIHAWTTAKPPLAAPDHITLTEAGSERSARALFTDIMSGYDAYQRELQAKAKVAAAIPQPPPPAHTKVTRKRHQE
jgi:hypothetical protein